MTSHRKFHPAWAILLVLATAERTLWGQEPPGKPELTRDEVALNRQIGTPHLFFPGRMSVVVNGKPATLLGITNKEVVVRGRGRKVARAPHGSVDSIVFQGENLTYEPANQTFDDFYKRLIKEHSSFFVSSRVYVNDPFITQYAIITLSPGNTETTSTARSPITAVPTPVYASPEPWTEVALLDPPDLIPEPKPLPPAPPRPAVAPAPAGGGIPTWGKFAIAATGIAAAFVLFKR